MDGASVKRHSRKRETKSSSRSSPPPPPRTFDCAICDNKKFTRYENLKKHYAKNHPTQKPQKPQKPRKIVQPTFDSKLVDAYKNSLFDFNDPETMPDSLVEFAPWKQVIRSNWHVIKNLEISSKTSKKVPKFTEMYNIRVIGQTTKNIEKAFFTIFENQSGFFKMNVSAGVLLFDPPSKQESSTDNSYRIFYASFGNSALYDEKNGEKIASVSDTPLIKSRKDYGRVVNNIVSNLTIDALNVNYEDSNEQGIMITNLAVYIYKLSEGFLMP